MAALVNNGMAEMVTLHPVAGGFIRLAGEFVDDAFGMLFSMQDARTVADYIQVSWPDGIVSFPRKTSLLVHNCTCSCCRTVFLYLALLIPFEISALAIILSFWSDDIPIWAVCLAAIILYA